MDSNLVNIPLMKGFTVMYQNHLKNFIVFFLSWKLTNVNLMMVVVQGYAKNNVGIDIFPSDLFLNNLGKRKPVSERSPPEYIILL